MSKVWCGNQVAACVRPAACVDVWNKLAAEERNSKEGALASILATHPTSKERAKYLEDALPSKEKEYESRCGVATQFRATAALT